MQSWNRKKINPYNQDYTDVRCTLCGSMNIHKIDVQQLCTGKTCDIKHCMRMKGYCTKPAYFITSKQYSQTFSCKSCNHIFSIIRRR